jgi:hypothetical protein
MFYRSDTLQEVDRLIRAFNGRYTLLDVTILDVRPLVNENIKVNLIRPEWENEAHKVFKEVLLLKKPDVILSL